MKKSIVLFSALICAFSVSAWDVVGHRIIADIAYQNLNKKARIAVDNVLGMPKGIIYYSSWPDEIKSDTIYPESSEWHYQDLDAGKTVEDLRYLYEHKDAEGYHLFSAKDSLTHLLMNEGNNVDALKFLVHLAGDEFQPMHMGHHDDLGANYVKLVWFGQNINQHSLWDSKIVDYYKYSSSEFAEMLINLFASQADTYWNMTEFDCICKTYAASTAIYEYKDMLESKKGVDGRYPRGYEYKYAYDFRATLEEQLYMAGIQLAKLLNEIYK